MYNNYDKNQSFEDFIKDYISENLDCHEGQSVYACELTQTLTEEDNINGTVFVYTNDNQEFIKDNWDIAADTHDYLKEDLDMVVNPFEEPERFVFCMVDKAVNDMLAESEYINENWNEEIVLNKETINQIKSECGIEYEENTLNDESSEEEDEEER